MNYSLVVSEAHMHGTASHLSDFHVLKGYEYVTSTPEMEGTEVKQMFIDEARRRGVVFSEYSVNAGYQYFKRDTEWSAKVSATYCTGQATCNISGDILSVIYNLFLSVPEANRKSLIKDLSEVVSGPQ